MLPIAAKRLGHAVKITADFNLAIHCVVCVYTNDHEDIPDVFRVLTTLWRNRLANKSITYKTTSQDKYFSPKPQQDITGSTENIQLFMIDIRIEKNVGLVAQLSKNVDDVEAKLTFFDPPVGVMHHSSRNES